jgi:hypothetical protein
MNTNPILHPESKLPVHCYSSKSSCSSPTATMPNKNLIIATVFAAVFAAVFLWAAIYVVNKYIHDCCLEFEHWFRAVTPPHWRRPCRHCELGLMEKSRSRSRRRSRSRYRSRSRNTGIIGNGSGNLNVNVYEERVRNSNSNANLRQVLPAAAPAPVVQRPMLEEQYTPWQGWQGPANSGQQHMGIAYPQPAMYPQAYPQMYPQPFQQPYTQPAPLMMPAPQHPPRHIPDSVSSNPTYAKPRKAHTAPSERSQPRAAPAKQKRVNRVRETDYIHLVAEYPPIVKESIRAKKAAAPRAPPSPSSSDSTEPAEEVPRASIPQGTPRAAFQYPQYPAGWDAPGNHPRQWEGNDQARYASPYMAPMGRVDVGRRYGLSNTPP